MDDQIIVISDDEDGAEDIIIISSDEENEDETKLGVIKFENHSHNIKQPKEESSTSDDEGFCKSSASDDDDLPDIPNLNICYRTLCNSESSGSSSVPCTDGSVEGKNTKPAVSSRKERKSSPVNLPCKKNLSLEEPILEPSVISCQKKRRSPVRSPSKKLKLEEESFPLEPSTKEEALARVLSGIQDEVSATLLTNNKQIITNNLMTGELRRDVLNLCSRDIDCCFSTHLNEVSC